MTLDGPFEFIGPKWSPDGRVLYLKTEIAAGLPRGRIEARNLDKTTTVVFEETGLLDFWWTSGPGSRLIYWKASASEGEAYDLFEVDIDERTSTARGDSRRLGHWVGDTPGFMSVSEDGKRSSQQRGPPKATFMPAALQTLRRTCHRV